MSSIKRSLLLCFYISCALSSCTCNKSPAKLSFHDLIHIKPWKIETQKLQCSDSTFKIVLSKNKCLIAFEDSSFETIDHKLVETHQVQFALKELITTQDFLKTGITTGTQDLPLLLKYAMLLEANKDSLPLKLKAGKRILIGFPVSKNGPHLLNFRGNYTNQHTIDWTEVTGSQNTLNSQTISNQRTLPLYIWFWEGPIVDDNDLTDNEKVLLAKNSHIATKCFYERVCYFKNNASYRNNPLYYKSFRIIMDTYFENRDKAYNIKQLDELCLARINGISPEVAQKYWKFSVALAKQYKYDPPELKTELEIEKGINPKYWNNELLTIAQKENNNREYHYIILNDLGWKALGIYLSKVDNFATQIGTKNNDSLFFCQLSYVLHENQLIYHQTFESINGKFPFSYIAGSLFDVSAVGYGNNKILTAKMSGISSREIEFLKLN